MVEVVVEQLQHHILLLYHQADHLPQQQQQFHLVEGTPAATGTQSRLVPAWMKRIQELTRKEQQSTATQEFQKFIYISSTKTKVCLRIK
jgi:hypothetical protein